MPKPTVALLMPNFTTGGAERQALLLARQLPRAGWRPIILVVERQGPLEEEALRLGIPIHDIGGELWRPKKTFGFWKNLSRCIIRISKVCRAERAIVLQSFLFWQNQLAVPAARITPTVKAVLTGRRNTGDYKDQRRHYQPIENFSNLFTTGIICNSQKVKRDLLRRERFTGGRVHVIPNAVDLDHIDRAAREDLRGRFTAPGEVTLIAGTVGNMKRQKRHDRFLEAIALARRENPGVHGVIVGRDLGEEAAIRAQITKLGLDGKVVLTGGVPDAAPFLKAFDLFILSSDYEGMPNAVLEAMAAEVPVITTEAGGVKEVIRDDSLGRVVEAGAGEIARHLLALAANSPLRRRIASNARERVARDFSPEALAFRHSRLYEELTGVQGAE